MGGRWAARRPIEAAWRDGIAGGRAGCNPRLESTKSKARRGFDRRGGRSKPPNGTTGIIIAAHGLGLGLGSGAPPKAAARARPARTARGSTPGPGVNRVPVLSRRGTPGENRVGGSGRLPGPRTASHTRGGCLVTEARRARRLAGHRSLRPARDGARHCAARTVRRRRLRPLRARAATRMSPDGRLGCAIAKLERLCAPVA
jgi:hypothetical protein